IDVVCSAKALNEGFDFPAAELGVSVSRNKSKTVYTQQLGRVVRKHGDKESMFIHLYLPGTKDQIYLEQATKGSVGIQWMSLDEFHSAIGQVE
ncbi:hypothetical protein GOV11_00710, partial [Candidatus Woesearchaeota archaeon]|nr:hypothetical protein [Candidatus Woesearchaeota archaeon]